MKSLLGYGVFVLAIGSAWAADDGRWGIAIVCGLASIHFSISLAAAGIEDAIKATQ